MKHLKQLKISVAEERWVTEQVNYICKGLKGGARFKREFTCSLNTSAYRSSTGGYYGSRNRHPRIKIGSGYFGLGEEYTFFHEYKAIQNSSVIGAIGAAGDLCYMALIAHELAHAIQQTAKYTDWFVLKPEWIPTEVTSRTWAPHGKVWQRIYAVLREEFVNEHAERLGKDAIIFGDPTRRKLEKKDAARAKRLERKWAKEKADADNKLLIHPDTMRKIRNGLRLAM